mgnify:FL=1
MAEPDAPDPTTEADVEHVLEHHADRLSALPNVVALGVDTDDVTGEPAVALYVSEMPVTAPAQAALPDGVDIATPHGTRRVGVKVIRVGSMSPQPLR